MSSVTLDEIVFDDSIYPRAAWSQATVDRYADALQADEVFPPIILEAGTRRLLDGKHRTEAHRAAGRHFIAVDFHEIPEGVPAKLYAASLSSRHGDPLAGEDKRQVARETATSNPDFSMVLIAKLLGTTRQTVSRYVGDLVEHRREVRRAQAALLDRAGWSHRQIGEHLGVDHKTVGSDVTSNISPQSEELLREAAADLPIDAAPLVAEILAERATPVTPGPVDADSAPPADPGTTPDPRDRTHGAEFESYDAAEPETCLGTDMDCGRPLPCPDHPAAGPGSTSPEPGPPASKPAEDPVLAAALAADSTRRAAIRNLTSVLTYLNPVAIAPAELAEREYLPVLDAFSQEELDRAAETMATIAEMKRGAR